MKATHLGGDRVRNGGRRSKVHAFGEMPEFISHGFNLDDEQREAARRPPGQPFPAGTTFFYAGQRPEVGQLVLLNLNFRWRVQIEDEEVGPDFCRMRGPVSEVLDRRTVRATVSASTDRTPRELGGDWTADLRYLPNFSYPWVLYALQRLPRRGLRPNREGAVRPYR